MKTITITLTEDNFSILMNCIRMPFVVTNWLILKWKRLCSLHFSLKMVTAIMTI